METKTKSHPIINFIKSIFERFSDTALFSIMHPDSSSSIGDDYLDDPKSFDKYTETAADEAGLSKTQYAAIKEAFKTSQTIVNDLEIDTKQEPAKKGKFEVDPDELEEIQPAEHAEVIERPSGRDRSDD